MSDETRDRLYELMAQAEDTQKEAAAAVAAMRVESAARAERDEAQAAAAQRMEAVAARLEAVPERVGADLTRTVGEAVAQSGRTALAGQREATGTATREALGEALGEGAATLRAAAEHATAAAAAVEGRLRAAADALGWRRTVVIAAMGSAAMVTTVGVGYGVSWWQGGQIEAQRATIARLTPEVERLEALAARGAELAPAARLLERMSLEAFMGCGEGICVRVDEREQFEHPDDPEHSTLFMVWGSDG